MESFYKLVEFAENLGLAEVESFTFRHVHHLLLCYFISLFVFSVEFDAASQNFDNLSRISLPDILDLFAGWDNFFLTVPDHLIRNLDEESSHLIAGVVESSNGMNHFDGIHQSWQSFNDLLRSSCVKWLNEFFQCGKIFNVVFCFI